MLDDRQRTLYARHLLLPEIGKSGQEALCAARVHAPVGADAHALSVARDYLERAGVEVDETGDIALDLPDLSRTDPALRDAVAAVAGAFAAVEAIKAIVGVGEPGTLDLEMLE